VTDAGLVGLRGASFLRHHRSHQCHPASGLAGDAQKVVIPQRPVDLERVFLSLLYPSLLGLVLPTSITSLSPTS
jgi:hypothetical protein